MKPARFRRLRMELRVVSPLHLGSGNEYLEGAEFVIESRQGSRVARLIDVERALLSLTDQEVTNLQGGKIATGLGQRRRDQFTVAVLPVRGDGSPNMIRALARAPDGQPYIPGSALKGSFRTALLRHLVRKSGSQPDSVGNREEAAARSLEERHFGVQLPGQDDVQFPNRDLNRAFRFSDFMAVGTAPTAFVSIKAHRLGGPGSGAIPIWCEAIEPGARFAGTLTVEYGGDLWDAARSAVGQELDDPVALWAGETRELARAEAASYRAAFPDVASWLDTTGGPGSLVFNLGWGGGWRSKTMGILLDAERVRVLADRYQRLSRGRSRDFPQGFPITRKLALAPGGMLLPPGWLALASMVEVVQ